MNSYGASCCTCFRTASCATGISASWPTGNVPLSCRFAFSCSTRHRRRSKTRQASRTLTIFGAAPSVLGRWSSSRDSRLPRCNFVLHLWSRLAHERTLRITKTLRASTRLVALCFVAEQISFSCFTKLFVRDYFALLPAPTHALLSSTLRCTASTHLNAAPSLHSIPIRARVRRKRGRLPSSRCIESAPEHRARLFILWLLRASDTALGLTRS